MRFSSLVVIVAFFAAAGCTSTSQSQNHASAIGLLRKVVQAHSDMGPTVTQFSVEVSDNGKPIPVHVIGTIRSNDNEHSVADAHMMIGKSELDRSEVVTNGNTQWYYDHGLNEYHQGGSDTVGLINLLIKDLRHLVAVPHAQTDMTDFQIDTQSFETQKVWRIGWHQSRGGAMVHGPARITLLIGKTNHLIRKMIVDQGNGKTTAIVQSYSRQARKFPEELFRFVPPVGSKESNSGAR